MTTFETFAARYRRLRRNARQTAFRLVVGTIGIALVISILRLTS